MLDRKETGDYLLRKESQIGLSPAGCSTGGWSGASCLRCAHACLGSCRGQVLLRLPGFCVSSRLLGNGDAAAPRTTVRVARV